jgi:hypothetical protein
MVTKLLSPGKACHEARVGSAPGDPAVLAREVELPGDERVELRHVGQALLARQHPAARYKGARSEEREDFVG